jgi:hypothetical protein
VRRDIGSSGAPTMNWRRFSLQAAREHRHLLFGLPVSLAAGGLDPAGPGGEGFRILPVVGERAPERLPGRRIGRIALHRDAQLRNGARAISGLQVFDAERVAQQRAVARRADQFLEGGNQRARHFR